MIKLILPNINLYYKQNSKKSATERDCNNCKVLHFLLKNTLKYIINLCCVVNFHSSHLSKNLDGVYMNANL